MRCCESILYTVEHEDLPSDPRRSPASELETITAVGDDLRGVDFEEPTLGRGASLGRYLVLERLGMGAMGVVYAAYDPKLDRKVAVKLVRPTRAAARSDEVRARLLREAQAMAKLSHPNVIVVHDVGTVDDQVFVAMEFIEGHSVRDWAKLEASDWPQRLAVMLQAGRGLAAAHDKSLVHRDFKPDNVMIDTTGRVVVMDFGLARDDRPTLVRRPPIESESPDDEPVQPLDRTNRGELRGTPAYMAPEQFIESRADARSDQFSFCVSLYELLYGERPFVGNSIHSLSMAVVAGEIESEPRATTVPRWIRRILLRGLDPDPALRWPSMHELLDALSTDPTRRGRTRWAVLGLVVTIGLLVAALSAGRRLSLEAKQAECEQHGRSIAQVWSAERRRALRDAWQATPGSAAEESLERMSSWLDTWTVRWSRERAAVCRQATIEQTLEPQLHARALACFSEQRDRLEALLEVHAHAEAQALPGAVKSAAGLTQLEPCGDLRLLAQRTTPPPEAKAEAIAMVRRDLAHSEALTDAGRYAEGLERAEAAMRQAQALGWPTLQAEATMVAASARGELGDYDEVQAELQRAFGIALRAGDDALAARVAIRLLRVIGYHRARTDEGLAWGAVAQALLERLERVDGLDAAALANGTGLAYGSRGDLESALEWHERALALRQAALGADHPEAAHSYGNIGNIHASREDYARALEWHGRALEVRTATLGPSHPDTARSHNNLGRVRLAKGDVEQALTHFSRALTIFEPAGGADHRVTARILHNLGDTLNKRGDRAGARRHYERALEIQRPLLGDDHPDTARSAHALGALLADQGDAAAALDPLRKALSARRRQLGDDHPNTRLTAAAIERLCRGGYAPACEGGDD